MKEFIIDNFNSSKVQLEPAGRLAVYGVRIVFQFQ